MQVPTISTDVFEKYLLNPLLKLALDTVPNVRLCVGRCLTQTIIVQCKLSKLFFFININYIKLFYNQIPSINLIMMFIKNYLK